ncbi:probable Tafazzin [Coccomyxa sp. Obi]|nr:probable Tafazzin [Coccomyxa sp. Obi]
MPILNSFTAPQLAAASIKGYRELLRKFRRDQAAEDATLLQQAKERVQLYKQRKLAKQPLDPRRAFSRLRDKVLEAKEDLAQLKKEKAGLLRATYAAVRGERASLPDDLAILGKDGPFRAITLAAVGAASKVFMGALSSTSVQGASIIRSALDRPTGQALITVSNHVASLDDPLVTAALLPAGALLRPGALRWTLCATDRCFTSPAASAFFRTAKVLPVERGAGLDQAGMRAAEARLAAGDWVHVFPEGTRSRDGRMGHARKGVGRLVAACKQTPLVVPFVHSGMDAVIPRGSALPRPGRAVRLLVGEPIPVADLMRAAEDQAWSDDRLYVAIADRIGNHLHALKAELEDAPLSEVVRERPAVVELDSEALLPLIEQELDSLTHALARPSTRQTSGLASVSSRAQESFAAATGGASVRLDRSSAWDLRLPDWESGSASTGVAMRFLRGSAPAVADKDLTHALQTAITYSSQRTQTAQRLMAV